MMDYVADILIVDDMPDNLNLLGDVLRAEGYKVRPAPSGKLALRAAENQPPDLIMLDITMPEMDGYEVCQKLKEDPKLASVPVIFISALTETVDKVKAFDKGGVDYVTKPFEPKEVLARVKTHCTLCRTQKELIEKNLMLQKAMEELKEAQVQLVQKEKMASLGVMTAGIAHEINNPINFVNSGVKGLVGVQEDLLTLLNAYEQSHDSLDEEGRKNVDRVKEEIDYLEVSEAIEELTGSILSGVKRTAEIVDGLRVFSHNDHRDKSLIEISGNIESAIILLKDKIKDKIKIHKEFTDVPMLLCYPGGVNQVFINILSNAIQAIERKDNGCNGEISINIRQENKAGREGVLCTVTDNGIGMKDDTVEHIFEPFYTTKEVGEGVGLGLSISHGIIKEHAGTIEARSAEGQGSVFEIWFPLQTVVHKEGVA